MTKIIFEKIIKSDIEKVFEMISNFENFEKLFPKHYPSIVTKSVRDESSLVAEHLKLDDKEFVIMAKHFNDPPRRHEMRVVGGDIKGSYIVEELTSNQSETKIVVNAEINAKKRFGIALKNTNYKKALEEMYDDIVRIIEKN